MKFRVLKEIEVETPKGIVTLIPGQVIQLSRSEAIPLIQSYLIQPLERVAYKVYSEVLQAYLWVVDTDADMHALRSQGITEAIYTADEIKKLKGIDKDSLRAIHKVKEVFENSKVEEIKTKEEIKDERKG